MKAVKKPIEIEYYPCELEYIDEILSWQTKERPIKHNQNNNLKLPMELYITTLEGIYKATDKDVIIKGIRGEVYPCKKEIFESTYSIL